METYGDHFVIRPTIDREFGPGDLSTIPDHKDNVHWFGATSDAAYIINVHVVGHGPGIQGRAAGCPSARTARSSAAGWCGRRG